MYVDVSSLQRNGKTYTRYLLRESYREQGNVKHRTLANLGQCSAAEVQAIRLALRHKHDLTALGTVNDVVMLHQGASVDAVWVVYEVARRLGIVHALGRGREAQLAMLCLTDVRVADHTSYF